ncbi:MAG: helix-turn-helix domain-containing protein [Actinomycetota bacterium]
MATRQVSSFELSASEVAALRSLATNGDATDRGARMARALLLAARGKPDTEVAAACGVSSETVGRWRRDFESEGLTTVGRIRPGRGRRRSVSDETIAAIVHDTNHLPPPGSATTWSTRAMAARHGVSKDTIAKIWHQHGVAPGRSRQSTRRSQDGRRSAPTSAAASSNRPVRLDRDRVAAAALRSGLQDLTISGVARTLGVTHGALYRYVKNRDDLAHAATELVARSIDWPSSDLPWSTHLIEAGQRTRRALDRHPGLYAYVIRLGSPPTFAAYEERTFEVLLAAGFPESDAVLAMDMLWHIVQDTAREAETGRYETTPAADQIHRKLTVLVAGLSQLLSGHQSTSRD